MHYTFHIILGILIGAAFTVFAWALSLRRYFIDNGEWPEHLYHGRVARRALAIGLLLAAALWAVPARCQPVDPRLGKWHDLPPAMNVVNAGFLLEHSATTRRDATYVALLGLAAGAVLHTQNPTVGLAVGTMALGYTLRLHLVSCKDQRRAGQLLQIGYRAEYLYDVVPDSIDANPHLRIIPR